MNKLDFSFKHEGASLGLLASRSLLGLGADTGGSFPNKNVWYIFLAS